MFYLKYEIQKAKTYSRYVKDTEKIIKVYQYGKLSVHKGRQQEMKKGIRELQNSRQEDVSNKSLPITNYSKCKFKLNFPV